MTDAERVVEILELLLAVGLLLLLFTGPWRQLVLDACRQWLFEIRDRAFLLAADGRIAFDDPIYRAFRERVNRRIRHLHDFSVYTLVFDVRDAGEEAHVDDLANAVAAMRDTSLRLFFERALLEMAAVTVVSMVFRSILFTLMFTLGLPFVIFSMLVSGRGKTKRAWHWLLRTAHYQAGH